MSTQTRCDECDRVINAIRRHLALDIDGLGRRVDDSDTTYHFCEEACVVNWASNRLSRETYEVGDST